MTSRLILRQCAALLLMVPAFSPQAAPAAEAVKPTPAGSGGVVAGGGGSTAQQLANQPTSVPLDQAAGFVPLGSSWNFSAGYQWRQIGDLDFRTGSQAARGSLPWMAGQGRRGSTTSTSGPTTTTVTSGAPASTTSTTATTGSDANFGNAGSASAFANRAYDNGYVNQFPGTAATGLTWFWGYQNASQVSGGTLSYRTTAPGATTVTTSTATGGSISTTTSSSTTSTTSYSSSRSSWSQVRGGLDWEDELAGSGWFARLESPVIFAKGALGVSMELGYSFANADAGQRQNNAFRAHQETVTRAITTQSTASTTSTTTTSATGGGTTTTTGVNTITDTYNIGGVALPAAPYSGTLAGPGPLITNVPPNRTITTATTTTSTGDGGAASSTSTSTSSSSVTSVVSGGGVVDRTTADFFSDISESIDVDLHTISLGPRFSWEWQRLRLGVSAGLAINIADWEAVYEEQLFVSQNGGRARLLDEYRDNSGGTEVIPGFYLEANANLRLTQHISLFLGGRYDWAGSLHGNVGPSDFALDLGGWSGQGGMTITF